MKYIAVFVYRDVGKKWGKMKTNHNLTLKKSKSYIVATSDLEDHED